MSYVTRSGRRTKKVNYADNKRPNSRSNSVSITPKPKPIPPPKPVSDKENNSESDSDSGSEIEIMSNNTDTVTEPPHKKQKISPNTAVTHTQSSNTPKKRRRHVRRKKTNTNTNNTNTNSAIPIPPLIPNNDIGLSHLHLSTRHNHKKTKPKKQRKKVVTKKISKQESSDSDSDDSSDSDSESDFEILPRKKRKLPTFKPKKKVTKRKSKPKKKKKVAAEKRLARKRKCTQKVRERAARARTQRIFMINAKVVSEYEREYAILGSTGNVYTITIGTMNSCTCPDYAKGNLCKHIIFVMIKVLRLSSTCEYVWQKALLTTELSEIFSAAPQTLFGTVLANANVRQRYKSSMGESDGEGESVDMEGKCDRKPLEGDCPVCMEEIDGSEATTYCRGQCGNNVHLQCFNEWKKSAERDAKEVECMFCRCAWVYGEEDSKLKGKKKATKGGGGGFNEGYLNLASEQGMSTSRDTSSYYGNGWNGYGRRRGYGWGYRRRW